MSTEIMIKNVKNIIVPFKDIGNGDCFVSVTEWANGEGYDISVDDGNVQTIQLHMDSLSALLIAVETLKIKSEEQ
jgi:hypothetical protein